MMATIRPSNAIAYRAARIGRAASSAGTAPAPTQRLSSTISSGCNYPRRRQRQVSSPCSTTGPYSDSFDSLRTVRNTTRMIGRSFWFTPHAFSKNPTGASPTTNYSLRESTPLNVEVFQSDLLSVIPKMARCLLEDGYYTTTDVLPLSTIQRLREQSIALRFEYGRFEQSYSETIDEATGAVKERFDKEGVYACEPDGRDYYDAQDLVTYMSVLLQTLPEALNRSWEKAQQQTNPILPTLSSDAFNAKLAVTEQGGAKYPLHVDNPQGVVVGDTRKLTCILYLNPNHNEVHDGGEIRLYLPSSNKEEETGDFTTVDLSPIGGRILVFWSDEIPHEVLPTATALSSSDPDKDRYALTIWIPTSNVAALHNASSKFRTLKDLVFAQKL